MTYKSIVYFDKNSHLITVSGLKDKETDLYVNDASVSARIKKFDGTDISAGPTLVNWPLTLSYVNLSAGIYRGVIPSDVGLSELTNGIGILKITITKDGPGFHAEIEQTIEVNKRKV